MNFRIETHDKITIVGLKLSTTNEGQAGYKDVPKMWQRFAEDEQTRTQLVGLMDGKPMGMIGVNVYNVDDADARKFDYYIGVAVSSDVRAANGLEIFTIPASTWAIFPCKAKDVGKTEFNVIKKWAPKSEYLVLNQGYESGYMVGQAPDLEIYDLGDQAEVWVAVTKK